MSRGLKVCLWGFCRGFKGGESRVSIVRVSSNGSGIDGQRLEVQGMEGSSWHDSGRLG